MKKSLAILALLSLSACASITTGKHQSITVETTPISGAHCDLSNDKGKWSLASTPGSVTVQRSYGELAVVCRKELHNGLHTAKSSTKGMAFGNILVGGIIGGAIDAGTGAAYDYPYKIIVDMKESTVVQK